MLTPAQVVPFLAYDDPLVRRLARDYFQNCGDPAPVTADDYWAALDRLGDGDDARALARGLAGLPQTDASVHRLVDGLAARPSTSTDDAFQQAARGVGFPLLVRHRDVLLGCPDLDPDVAAHLARRLELAEVPADAAWDQLMAVGLASAGKYADKIDATVVDALIEATARHMDALAPRVMRLLSDDAVNDWREVFAVRVVGHARYAPAAAVLVRKLQVDADVLLDEAVDALGRIGTDDVIDRLGAFAPAASWWGIRLYPAAALARVKRPPSEAAVVRLLGREKDADLRDHLLNDLADLCSLAGLDAARRSIAADPKHPESIGLCERLIATAAMHGVTLPEEPRWREWIAAREAWVAAQAARMDAGGLQAFADRMRERSPDFADAEPDEPPPEPPHLDLGGYDPYARFEPIRNDQLKVGRNDPCPCGSGKKYKKCHGAAS